MLFKELIKKYWWVAPAILALAGAAYGVNQFFLIPRSANGEPATKVEEAGGAKEVVSTAAYSPAPHLYPDQMVEWGVGLKVSEEADKIFEEGEYKLTAYIQYGDLLLFELTGLGKATGDAEIWTVAMRHVGQAWIVERVVLCTIRAEYEPHYERFQELYAEYEEGEAQ